MTQAESSVSLSKAEKRTIPPAMPKTKIELSDPKRDALRRQMAEAKTTPTELSREIGRGKDYVRDYLAGRKADFSRSEWEAIAAFLRSKGASVDAPNHRELLEIYDSLPPDLQDAYTDVLRKLAEPYRQQEPQKKAPPGTTKPK